MFTILNLLNYFVGKPVNAYILIAITIVVYACLIHYFYDKIYQSYVYIGILIFLLILDIISKKKPIIWALLNYFTKKYIIFIKN